MSKLLLIDGHSILNRAFYGMPHMSNGKGLPTNAVYGFLTIMFKLIENENPTHMVVAFDTSAPTFRHNLYDGYKGNRKPAPDDFRVQVPMMKDMLKAMGIFIMEQPGIEADDILGTFAKRAEAKGMDVILYSGDKDLLQIVSDKILVRVPKTSKGVTTEYDYHTRELMEEYGVTPAGFIDLKAIMGDNSDNYNGVEGVGEVGALKLLKEYGSLENLYDHIGEIKGKLAEKLINGKEDAFFCRKLATIITDAEIETDFDKVILGDIYTSEAFEKCKELNFRNFLTRFENTNTEPDNNADEIINGFLEISNNKSAIEIFEKAASESVIGICVRADKRLSAFEEAGGQMSLFEISRETKREVVSVAFANGKTYFIDNKNVDSDIIIDGLRKLYIGNTMIVTDNMKQYLHVSGLADEFSKDMSKHFFDVTIAAYVLNPLKSEPDVSAVAQWYLGIYPPELDIKLEKKIDISAESRPTAFLCDFKHDAFMKYVCLNSALSLRLADTLRDKLKEDGELSLYENIELPTTYVLYAMEKEGMPLKKDELRAYGDELAKSIDELEAKILNEAGETKDKFNINSPKQLGELLFEKMGLEGGKKTKTGYSTSAEVLEKLAEDNPICRDIIEYRTLAKLKSTYVEGLSDACEDDGRIHSTFNQTVTATGRISSNDPNLQNIPTRYELGRKMRKVFVAKEGCEFCDADYSQIELRLLAAFSEDKDLINAYRDNKDIHRMTASKVFHVPFEEVTDLMRRNAKAVNFGIVYGISSFGLSQDLSISREEAKQYIADYFETYPSIREYLEKAKADAKENGYSVTYFGRRRPIPELKETNFMRRQFGERVAMNAPLQGSAADIMKIAMVRVYDLLKERGLKSKLVLQVHDELIVEAYEEEKEAVLGILKEGMEGAAELSVNLEVSSSCGKSWYEAK